jgi:hypothetical protein
VTVIVAKKATKRPSARNRDADTIGKRLVFDRETWQAVEMLARDRMQTIQELTEEAFGDFLKKHGRSADFREALRLSARAAEPSRRRRQR